MKSELNSEMDSKMNSEVKSEVKSETSCEVLKGSLCNRVIKAIDHVARRRSA